MKRGMRGVYQGVSFAKWVVRVVLRVWERVGWKRDRDSIVRRFIVFVWLVRESIRIGRLSGFISTHFPLRAIRSRAIL